MTVEDIPADLAERAALYRRRLSDAARSSGTRPLILLDDIWDAGDLQYFRPASAGVILATSDRIAGDEAPAVTLDVLSAQESFEVLASRMDPDRARFERNQENLVALQRLVQLCGGVPLAVAIMAGALEMAVVAGEAPGALADEMDRAYGAPSATAPAVALALSYPRLTAEQRHVLHTMALLAMPAFDLSLIAAASWLGRPAARAVVGQLVHLSLVEPFGVEDDRWRLHPVVFGFIGRLIPERVMADKERILTEAARLYLRRSRSLVDLLGMAAAVSDPAIAAWAREQMQGYSPALLALLRATLGAGLTQVARRLAASVIKLAELSGGWPELGRTMETVVATARETADPTLEASALGLLARESERHGLHRSAADLRDRARAMTRHAESGPGRAAEHAAEGSAGNPAVDFPERRTEPTRPSADGQSAAGPSGEPSARGLDARDTTGGGTPPRWGTEEGPPGRPRPAAAPRAAAPRAAAPRAAAPRAAAPRAAAPRAAAPRAAAPRAAAPRAAAPRAAAPRAAAPRAAAPRAAAPRAAAPRAAAPALPRPVFAGAACTRRSRGREGAPRRRRRQPSEPGGVRHDRVVGRAAPRPGPTEPYPARKRWLHRVRQARRERPRLVRRGSHR